MKDLKNTILDTELLPSQTACFYLGQVGFLFKHCGKIILVDPYLSDYVDNTFSTEEVKWVRRYPAPISAGELDFADLILCTHPHADHTDPWTLKDILKSNDRAIFAGPDSVCDVYEEIGIPPSRICRLKTDAPESFWEGMNVTAIPAAHEELHPDGAGGYVETGFLLELDGRRIFHSGDCCPYKGLEERIMDCDMLILPVNGRDYYRRYEQDIIGCFEPKEASIIAKRTNARMLVPVHIDLYDVNALNPAVFVDTIQQVDPMLRYHIFSPGEGYILF
ncbi:MAG: MBL fold metallo-hydrolase [Blautia sp.]|nr:MBL fold metallo-hydrolase [Blautia sp.]